MTPALNPLTESTMFKPTTPSNRTKAAAAAISGLLLSTLSPSASAETWSDTAISWRHGQKFAEPFGPNDITKNIFALTHIGGYAYGTNFFNVDLLQSNGKDPGVGTSAGA